MKDSTFADHLRESGVGEVIHAKAFPEYAACRRSPPGNRRPAGAGFAGLVVARIQSGDHSPWQRKSIEVLALV